MFSNVASVPSGSLTEGGGLEILINFRSFLKGVVVSSTVIALTEVLIFPRSLGVVLYLRKWKEEGLSAFSAFQGLVIGL